MQSFVVLEKFTCAYLLQIALETIRLPTQIALPQLTP